MNQFKFEDNFFKEVENILQENSLTNKQPEELKEKIAESQEETLLDIMDFKKIFSKKIFN